MKQFFGMKIVQSLQKLIDSTGQSKKSNDIAGIKQLLLMVFLLSLCFKVLIWDFDLVQMWVLIFDSNFDLFKF